MHKTINLTQKKKKNIGYKHGSKAQTLLNKNKNQSFTVANDF